MTTWEYFVDTVPADGVFITGDVPTKDLIPRMNSFGEQGWELVSSYTTAYANGGTHLLVFIYRRPQGAIAVPPVSAAQ